MELIYKDEAYAIIGACFEVYHEVGYGFGEPIYQECLGNEDRRRSRGKWSTNHTNHTNGGQGRRVRDDWCLFRGLQ
ncbi:MAG TPA: GxxExxY protein [Pirellulales bacterium]|nr:GxxExxY protein [Pirellulales bacterium]